MLALSLCILFVLFAMPCQAQLEESLADGSSFRSGSLSSSVKWQSSGVFGLGGCQTNVAFSPCFTASLSSTGQESPARDRQRVEILSWPPAEAGESWTYDWYYHLVPEASSSEHFFHLVQLLSRDLSAYLIALDLYNNTIRLFDTVRDCAATRCPSIDVAEFEGETTRHRMEVTFGPRGSLDYLVTNAATKATLLSYNFSGNVPAGSSLKTGLYRRIREEQTVAVAHLGAFDFTRVA